MSLYETVCVLRPELSGEAMEKITGKVQKVLTENNVKEVQKSDWGLRKLAYPIQKLKTAHYLQFVYEGGGELVGQLERQLNYEDAILRYLTVKVENGVNPNTKPDSFNFSKVEDDAPMGRRSYGGGRDFRKYGKRYSENDESSASDNVSSREE